MLSRVISVPFTALHSTNAALQLKPPQSCAAKMFYFWLIHIHSNAGNSLFHALSVIVEFVLICEKLHGKRCLLVLLIVPVSYF